MSEAISPDVTAQQWITNAQEAGHAMDGSSSAANDYTEPLGWSLVAVLGYNVVSRIVRKGGNPYGSLLELILGAISGTKPEE